MADMPSSRRRPPTITKSDASGDTISRNALFSFATQLGTATFTAGLTIFLTRALGPAAFGTFSLALAVTGLLHRAAAGATSQAVARYVAEHRGNVPATVGVVGMALRIRMLSALAIAAGFFILAGPIASAYNEPDLVWPLRGAGLALFGQSIVGFGTSIFTALRHSSRSFVLVTSESAVEFSASVILVLAGGGATSAAFGRTIGYTFGALLAVLLVGRILGRSALLRTGQSPVPRREFAGYASAMLIITSASAIFAQIDGLILGAILGTTAVGIYSAAGRLIALVSYPAAAVAQAVGPRQARHPDDPPNVRALQRAIKYVVIVQAAVVAVLLTWAEPIVRLAVGSEFVESAPVLRALAPFVFLSGLLTLFISSLNYAGEARRRIPISVAALGLNAGLDVVLIHQMGILGAAVAADIAYGFFSAGNIWLAHRILGVPLKPVALSAVRAFAAAAAMAGTLAVAGTHELSVVEWIGGGTAGVGILVAVLVTMRELSLAELRSLIDLPAKGLRRS